MTHESSILSSEEEYDHVRDAICSYMDTYGNCEVKLYEPGKTIEEDGLTITGEYGTLDALFSPITDQRLKRAIGFEDGRRWMNWNAVVFSVPENSE